MPRRYDKRGLNRQFKWQPVRRDRWDPFPKDHIAFVDDFSAASIRVKVEADPNIPSTPPPTPNLPTKRPGKELPTPSQPPRKKPWGKRHPIEKDLLIAFGVVGGAAGLAAGAVLAPEIEFPALAGFLGGGAAEEIEMTPLLRGRAVNGIRKGYGSVRKAARVIGKFRRSKRIGWRAARQVYKML